MLHARYAIVLGLEKLTQFRLVEVCKLRRGICEILLPGLLLLAPGIKALRDHKRVGIRAAARYMRTVGTRRVKAIVQVLPTPFARWEPPDLMG